jgi:hypothetical protein
MFIPLKMVLIGIDPYPYNAYKSWRYKRSIPHHSSTGRPQRICDTSTSQATELSIDA